MLVCPMCDKSVEKFHPKSHINPEWMYRSVYDDRHKTLLLGLKGATKTKRQKGVYKKFICSDCEIRFSNDDRYASLALAGRNKDAPEFKSVTRKILHVQTKDFTVMKGLDFIRLQRFIFGVVLRGVFAQEPKEKPILIKSHVEKIKSLYLENDNLDDLTYPIMIQEFFQDDLNRNILFLPYHTKIDKQHAVQFGGEGMMFTVIASGHQVSDTLGSIRLMKSGSIVLVHGKFAESGTFKGSVSALRKIFIKYPGTENSRD